VVAYQHDMPYYEWCGSISAWYAIFSSYSPPHICVRVK